MANKSEVLCDMYHNAVHWIADNDNPGDDENVEDIATYISTMLVADLFDVTPKRVARDVASIRSDAF